MTLNELKIGNAAVIEKVAGEAAAGKTAVNRGYSITPQ